MAKSEAAKYAAKAAAKREIRFLVVAVLSVIAWAAILFLRG